MSNEPTQTVEDHDDPAKESASTQCGVFISHAAEDSELAEAFQALIHDASAGMVPTYASSATDEGKGIPYGDDWFRWIRDNIKKSHILVALITEASVGRPWILFEAGLGKGVSGTQVFGVRFGVSAEDAYKGPFNNLHNSGSEKKELLKICKQIFQGTPANPRDERLTQLVEEFSESASRHVTQKKVPSKKDTTSEAVFKALEEMKFLVDSSPRKRSMSTRSLEEVLSIPNLSASMHVSLITAALRSAGYELLSATVESFKDSTVTAEDAYQLVGYISKVERSSRIGRDAATIAVDLITKGRSERNVGRGLRLRSALTNFED